MGLRKFLDLRILWSLQHCSLIVLLYLCKPKNCPVKKCPSCYIFFRKNQENNISQSSMCFILSSDFIIGNNSVSGQYFMGDTILCYTYTQFLAAMSLWMIRFLWRNCIPLIICNAMNTTCCVDIGYNRIKHQIHS